MNFYHKTALALSVLVILVGVQSAEPEPLNQKPLPRPIQLGASGGNIKDASRLFCCGGTLGALVQDVFGTQFVLSNNHVLAKTNQGRFFDTIIQPALIDQNPSCARDASAAIANLWSFVPISFTRGTTNTVDAAIALVQIGRVDPTGSILGIGTPSNSIVTPTLNMSVKKSGRTTGLTTGTVTAVSVTVNVVYSKRCGSLRSQIGRFTNQFMVKPVGFGDFGAGGDSGSLIVENCSPNPRAVGLLFAGSQTATLANPISQVLSAFGVSMVGAGGFCSLRGISPRIDDPAMITPSQLVEAASQVKARYEKAILNLEGVVGMGVGLSDTTPGQVVIEAYVKRLSPEVRRMIPAVLEGILVKIVETGEFLAY